MTNPKRKPRKPKKLTPSPAQKATSKPLIKKASGKPTKKTCGIAPAPTPTPDALTSRSTTTSAQLQRVIAALRTGPKTTHDLRGIGIYQCPARVKQLRDEFGYTIITTRVPLINDYGYAHRSCGLYTLISDPPQLGLDFGRDAANDPKAKP